MTLNELEAAHGVTLHDALLSSLSTNFVARVAELRLSIWVGEPDAATEAEREARRSATLRLTGLVYLVVDPPDPRYPYAAQEAVQIDSCHADEALSARYPTPPGGFCGRLYVTDWNSFIHFAAISATLTWDDDSTWAGVVA